MHRFLLRTAAALLVGAASLAYSQEDSREDAVVVEATRFPEDVRRLPASTTVLTEEDIRRSAARTLPELLAGQVGITMRDLYGNNAAVTSVDLRGFGATGPQNTLVLLDGRRLSDLDLSSVQWSSVPLASIERIEIVRGSGAVLYGDAASAGVVNIITRSPLKRGPAFEAYGRAGTFDTLEGRLYGAYSGERLGINASLYGFDSDGYRDNNRNEQRNADVNLRWALGEGALDLHFGTDEQELRLPGVRRVQPSIGLDEVDTDRRGTATPNDFASRDGRRAGLELSQRFGEAEVSLALDYRDKDARIFNEPFFRYQADDLELWSLSPRVRVPLEVAGTRHRITVGVDLREWRYGSRRADRPQNHDRPANRLHVDHDTRGIYVQDLVQVTPSVDLTLGYRHEKARYRARDDADPTSPACFFCTEAPALKETQKQHAWELGGRWSPLRAVAFFARANRSFRFANVDEIYEFSPATFTQVFDLLEPQHARTYEVGAEWRSGGHAVRAALFRTDATDEIHLNPLAFDNVNLPPSRREGLELEAAWQAAQTLRLTAAYAYTDARFREGTLEGFAPGTGGSIAGRRVPLVPRHKLDLGVQWRIVGRTHLSVLATAVSSQHMDNDERNLFPRRIPGYGTVDAKLAQEFAWGRLAFSVNNVLDKEYFAYAVSSNTTDLANVYPLPGRAYYVSAEVRLP